MPNPQPPVTAKALYGYQPSLAVAMVGAVVFTSVAAYTVYQYVRNRTWFLYMLILGVLLEVASAISRVISVADPSNVWAFLIAYLVPIVAPSFIAAACYMTFGRILWYVTPSDRRNFRSLWLPARWVAPVFVLFDMGAFLIQFLGVAAATSAYTDPHGGKAQQAKIDGAVRVLKFGLVAQLVCFGVFALIGSRFMFISRGWPVVSIDPRPGWRRLAWSVNTSATLIMLRGIYRVFEFSASESKIPTYVTTHEWLFWTCDVLPILCIFGLFLTFHPGGALPFGFTRWRLDKKRLRQQQKGKGPADDALQGGEGLGRGEIVRGQSRSAGYVNLQAAMPPGFGSTTSGGSVFAEEV